MVDTEFDPKRPADVEYFGIDFKNVLAVGETITAYSMSVSINSGRPDVNVSAMKQGLTTVSGTKVLQKVGGGISGNKYNLKFSIDTSIGQHFDIVGLLHVRD